MKAKKVTPKKKTLSTEAETSRRKIRMLEIGLRHSEETYKKLIMASPDPVFITTVDGSVIYASERMAAMLCYGSSDQLATRHLLEMVRPDEKKKAEEALGKIVAEGYAGGIELNFLDCTGKGVVTGELNASLIRDTDGRPMSVIGIIRDVTSRKHMEKAHADSEALYRMLIETSPDAILITDREHKIIYASDKFVELVKADALHEVIGKKSTQYIKGGLKPGSNKESENKVSRVDGTVITGEISASAVFDSHGREKGYMAIIRDITARKENEEKTLAGLATTKKIVEGIIHSMEKLVEKKDIYTVGHQHRTAELAVAIAGQMGYSKDRLEGIYTASLIHDIGKIFISGHILNKLSTLTAEEYDIIKKHPEAGYEVLKEIDFPWPIADMIFQHHERVDGSGYPRGLKGDKILHEAKIIAVSDVVEAMTFARPYRPGLGIDRALQEIEKNKGKLYDLEVANVCAGLFTSGKFKFSI